MADRRIVVLRCSCQHALRVGRELLQDNSEPTCSPRAEHQRCTVVRERRVVIIGGVLCHAFQGAFGFRSVRIDRQAPEIRTHGSADEHHPAVRRDRRRRLVRGAERCSLRCASHPPGFGIRWPLATCSRSRRRGRERECGFRLAPTHRETAVPAPPGILLEPERGGPPCERAIPPLPARHTSRCWSRAARRAGAVPRKADSGRRVTRRAPEPGRSPQRRLWRDRRRRERHGFGPRPVPQRHRQSSFHPAKNAARTRAARCSRSSPPSVGMT